MARENLAHRTKQFTLRVIRVVNSLPRDQAGRVISWQLMKSGSSVGANYRAACRARSRREFIAKLGIVVEEADESAFWLEVIMEAGILPTRRIKPLHQEATELLAIMIASRKTARRKGADQD